MDALATYGGDSSDSDGGAPPRADFDRAAVVAAVAAGGAAAGLQLAPRVAPDLLASSRGAAAPRYTDPSAAVLSYNPRVGEMHGLVQGPAAAGQPAPSALARRGRNHAGGHVEAAGVARYAFDAQLSAEEAARGLKRRADGSAAAGAVQLAAKMSQTGGQGQAQRQSAAQSNPWFAKLARAQRTLTAEQAAAQGRLMEERAAAEEAKQAARDAARAARDGGGEAGPGAADPSELPAAAETSRWHGGELTDYQGRSWLAGPSEAKRPTAQQCYVPKRLVHTYTGHSKGVSAIRFFPRTGHLLLSAAMDGKLKIWDVGNKRRVLRTYEAHSAAVRDCCFNADGTQFASAAYDKNVRLWDTETGQLTASFNNGRVPYCCVIHPDEDKQHIVMAGMGDNKIVQWDTRTGNVEQEYDYHLGPVNSITFLDENRRFVSSSDDKSMRVWDYGVPIQIKYIADPGMQSMPSVALHPNSKWFCCQSLDNTIVTYSARDRFRANTKKTFRGHNNAGYAPQVSFSPDGQYVLSGDGEGRAFVWDFKTTKYVKNLRAHEGVCSGAVWHPLDASKIATCGWGANKDAAGTIKLWD